MNLCVITATRGESAHLEAAVRSVQEPGVAVRHLLVCPGTLVSRLQLQFPRCEVVAESGPGLYAALNTGLALVRADELFTWLNDDDLLVPAGFRQAVAQLAADPALGLVYGGVGLVDGAGRPLGSIPVAHRVADLPALLASGIMPLAQPGTLCRAGVLAATGRFDPGYRLAGDLDFFIRALQAGACFGFCPAEVARFRLHPRQLSKDAAAAAAEHARAITGLPQLPAAGARWRFRWDNRRVYWARIRRHGFVRMSTLYRHG